MEIEYERIFSKTIWDFGSEFQINTQDKVIVLAVNYCCRVTEFCKTLKIDQGIYNSRMISD